MNKSSRETNRWMVAIMGTLLMIVLGSVYAWSFFQKPIVETFGWSNSGVAWVFSTNILFLGLAASWGGGKIAKYGATSLAVVGVTMYGIGFILGGAALSLGSLPLLILGFGVVGGTGIGLGYVTPVVSASKWFPDKQGFVTGMVVMGFGFGALVMSKLIAPTVLSITENNLVNTFYIIGVIILLLGMISAPFIKQPQITDQPKETQKRVTNEAAEPLAKEALRSSNFILLWTIFFVNITAGIMFISFQSPLIQDLWSNYKGETNPAILASVGGTLIAVSSLFNGFGRFFWGGLSDKIGRVETFRIILSSQIIIFILLLFVSNPFVFAALVCYVLLCYGGGFGTIPAFVRELFSDKLMAVVYGAILTAWSAGGVIGPQIVALMKDNYPNEATTYSFTVGALLLTIGLILTFFIKSNRTTSLSK